MPLPCAFSRGHPRCALSQGLFTYFLSWSFFRALYSRGVFTELSFSMPSPSGAFCVRFFDRAPTVSSLGGASSVRFLTGAPKSAIYSGFFSVHPFVGTPSVRSSASTFSVHSISGPPSVQFSAATLCLRPLLNLFCALYHRCFFHEFFRKVFSVCFMQELLTCALCSEFFGAFFHRCFFGLYRGTSLVRSFAFHRVFSVCFITRDFCVCSLPGASSEHSSAVAFFSVHTFALEFSMSSSAGIFSLSVHFLPGCFQCARSQGPSCCVFSPGLSPCAFSTGFSACALLRKLLPSIILQDLFCFFCALIDRTSLMGSSSGVSSLHYSEGAYSVHFFTGVPRSVF